MILNLFLVNGNFIKYKFLIKNYEKINNTKFQKNNFGIVKVNCNDNLN